MAEKESAMLGILRPMFFEGDKLNAPAMEGLELMLAKRGYEITGMQGSQLTVTEKQGGGGGEEAPNVPDFCLDGSYQVNKISHWTLHQRAKGRDGFQLYDSGGASKYFTKGKVINLRSTYKIKDAEGETLAIVQRKIFHMGTPFRPYYKVTRGTDEEDVMYKIMGNFGGYLFSIKNTDDQVVATVREKASVVNGINKKKNSYELAVQPGVDALMMSFLGIVCDLIDNEG